MCMYNIIDIPNFSVLKQILNFNTCIVLKVLHVVRLNKL